MHTLQILKSMLNFKLKFYYFLMKFLFDLHYNGLNSKEAKKSDKPVVTGLKLVMLRNLLHVTCFLKFYETCYTYE
jgi:hypothetical protein